MAELSSTDLVASVVGASIAISILFVGLQRARASSPTRSSKAIGRRKSASGKRHWFRKTV